MLRLRLSIAAQASNPAVEHKTFRGGFVTARSTAVLVVGGRELDDGRPNKAQSIFADVAWWGAGT